MAFDGNAYRKDVLARLLADFAPADPVSGDVFFVCSVQTNASDAEVAVQLKAVKAFWNKELNHPRYKTVARPLLDNYAAYEALLVDPTNRRAAAERVAGARGVANAEAITELDRLVRLLTVKSRGIPRSKIPTLQTAAARRGLESGAFADWLSRQAVIDDVPSGYLPWDAPVRRQVRSALDELARLTGDLPRYRTLWTFLLVSPSAGHQTTSAAYDRLLADNTAGRHDRPKTLTGDLLATVKTRLLVDGGAESYTATLRADAIDSVAGEVEEHGLLSGSLAAADVAALSARIASLSWGFDAHAGRELVVAAAKAAGVAVEVGEDVDLIVCGSCGKPQPAGRHEQCRYCGSDLYRPCPGCATRIETASDVCSQCGLHVRSFDAALGDIGRARDLLEAGQPAAALTLLSQHEALLSGARKPDAYEVALSSARATLGAARENWSQVSKDLTASKYWTAARGLDWLRGKARDVPGPDGENADVWRDRVATEQSRIQLALKEAQASPEAEREQRLRLLIREAPDFPEALSTWARLPLEPARQVSAIFSASDGGVVVSWSRSASRDATYRVERRTPDPKAAKSLGVTSSTSIADGGAPGGVELRYAVTAVEGDRSSAVVESGPVFIERDISAVNAVYDESGRKPAVLIRWPIVPGAGQVLIERADVTGAEPLRRMRPRDEGELRDDLLTPGLTYEYRAFVEYQGPNGRSTTPGSKTRIHVPAHPAPVKDIWASTGSDGRTKVSFTAPEAGEVYVIITDRPIPLAIGAAVDLSKLSGARILGPATRRVIDQDSHGRVVYTAVTTRDGSSVIGSCVAHAAVSTPSQLRVASRTEDVVVVDVTLPSGVSTAFFSWRYDRSPTGPDDRAAQGLKVSSGRLLADGGVHIDLPRDGRGLYVACFPGIHVEGAVEAVNAPARMVVAEPKPAPMTYEIDSSGLLRRRYELRAKAIDGYVLPPFEVRAADTEDLVGQQGARVIYEHPGGGTNLETMLDLSALSKPSVIKAVSLPPAGVLEVHPTVPDRTVRP